MAKKKPINLTSILGIGGPGANPEVVAQAAASAGGGNFDPNLLFSKQFAPGGPRNPRGNLGVFPGGGYAPPAVAASTGAVATPDRRTFLQSLLSGDRAKALKRFAKTPEAKIMGATVLLDLVARSAMGLVGQSQQAEQQGQALDMQAQYAPQIAEQQALQPVTEARKEQALAMLMRQMGQSVPNLAEGEVWT